MGRAAVGTTRTFGKRNGGSQENDIGITGSSFPRHLSLVHQLFLLCFDLFLTMRESCGILVYRPGIETGSLNPRTARELPHQLFIIFNSVESVENKVTQFPVRSELSLDAEGRTRRAVKSFTCEYA